MENGPLAVDIDAQERIVVATVDRPTINSQNRHLREELIGILDFFGDRDDERATVLTGVDLHERDSQDAAPGAYAEHNRTTREWFFAVECERPVIAAIKGPAIGAGYALASCADILVASDRV